jgi:hypothetical protein
MPYEPPFPIGHLHQAEQRRIRDGNLNPHERGMLAKGKDPWNRFRGSERSSSESAKKPIKNPDPALVDVIRDDPGQMSKDPRLEPTTELQEKKSASSSSGKAIPIAKLLATIVLAFASLYGFVAAAFQVAGVSSLLLAHSLIAMGWLAFMASVLLIERVLALPRKKRITVTVTAAIACAAFMLVMDRWMVNLKVQQQIQAKSALDSTPFGQTHETPTQSDEQLQVANVGKRIPLDIAPEKLVGFFEKYNEAQAEELTQPYIGTWMETQGRAIEISRDALLPNEGDGTIRYGIAISLRTERKDKPKSPMVTHALFDERRWIDRAKVVNRNEIVSVRGRIKYVYSFGFYLEHCEIIE